MFVKFIVVNNGGKREVVFGTKAADDDRHRAIAEAYARERGLDFCAFGIEGGGWADLEKKRIFGHSVDYKRYSARVVHELLGDDWDVEASSFPDPD